MHIPRPLVGLAAGIAVALVLQTGSVGSTPPPLPDGITAGQADAVLADARAAAVGTPAAAALLGGATAAEHRRAVDDALACLVRDARAIGVEVTVRGPRPSADGSTWAYTYGARRTARSSELPGLEQACRARHLDQIERAHLAQLASRADVLAAGREGFDTCFERAGLGEHLDPAAPAPEVARRATSAAGDVDAVLRCAAAHPLLFTAHLASGRGAADGTP